MANGWQQLGQALAGPSEASYQEGLAMGAKTQDALASARRRVDENRAREQLPQSLGDIFIGNLSPTDEALAYATAARSGINLGDLIGARGEIQEQGFRGRAADRNVPLAEAQRAMLAVSGRPATPFASVGEGMYQDIFNPDAGVQTTPLGEALVDSRAASAESSRASAALADERRMNPERFRSGNSLAELLGIRELVDAPPPSTIFPEVDTAKGTGLPALLSRIANIGADTLGMDLPFDEQEQATEALSNLQTQTITTAQSAIPGRPSNFLMQQLQKLTVDPADVVRGDARAIIRLKQTRDMFRREVERLRNMLVNPAMLNSGDRSKARIAFEQLRQLTTDYDAAIAQYGGGGEEEGGTPSPAALGVGEVYTDGTFKVTREN